MSRSHLNTKQYKSSNKNTALPLTKTLFYP